MTAFRLANASNGLAFPPWDDICMFQSQHAHHCLRCGYFRMDAMPWRATLHLLRGGSLCVVDATRRRKPLTDALRYGLPTWCLVFNRALGQRRTVVCDWQTRAMVEAANSERHKPVAHGIRKLARAFGLGDSPVLARIGVNVFLECHQAFDADDKPRRLARRVLEAVGT